MKGVQSRWQRVRKLRISLPVCLDRESHTEEQNFVHISRLSCLVFLISSSLSSSSKELQSGGNKTPGFRESILMA